MAPIHPYESLLNSVVQCCTFERRIGSYRMELYTSRQHLLDCKYIIPKYPRYKQELMYQLNNFQFGLDCDFSSIRKFISELITLESRLTQLNQDSKSLLKYSCLNGADERVRDCDDFIKQARYDAGINNIMVWSDRVLKRIDDIKNFSEWCKTSDQQVSTRWESLQKQVECIKGYADDRYNRANVILLYNEMCPIWPNKYDNADKFNHQLNLLQESISKLEAMYNKERDELTTIDADLRSNSLELWKDDCDRYKTAISNFIIQGNRKYSFDIEQIKKEIISKKNDKQAIMARTLKKYTWLKKKSYCNKYDQIISENITSDQYFARVNALRKERKRNIWSRIWRTTKYILIGLGIIVGVVGALYLLAILIPIAIMMFILSHSNNKD